MGDCDRQFMLSKSPQREKREKPLDRGAGKTRRKPIRNGTVLFIVTRGTSRDESHPARLTRHEDNRTTTMKDGVLAPTSWVSHERMDQQLFPGSIDKQGKRIKM